MTAAPRPDHWTPEQYLEYERASETRHEFWNGEIFEMAGASEQHNLIVGSTYASLYAQLRKRDCKLYPSDMRLKVTATGLFTYPDISIVCGEAQFLDDKRDTLLNPVTLIEVLSPSTERYDRGKKFQNCRTMQSLQEYILIAQDTPRIEYYRRQSDDQWLLSDIDTLTGTLTLSAINCTLSAADVYEKVTFDDSAPTPTE